MLRPATNDDVIVVKLRALQNDEVLGSNSIHAVLQGCRRCSATLSTSSMGVPGGRFSHSGGVCRKKGPGCPARS